jgi:hypothetical protein
MYCAELEPGRHVEFELARGRQAYLLCVEDATGAGGSGAGDDKPIQLVRRCATNRTRPSGVARAHCASSRAGGGPLRVRA